MSSRSPPRSTRSARSRRTVGDVARCCSQVVAGHDERDIDLVDAAGRPTTAPRSRTAASRAAGRRAARVARRAASTPRSARARREALAVVRERWAPRSVDVSLPHSRVRGSRPTTSSPRPRRPRTWRATTASVTARAPAARAACASCTRETRRAGLRRGGEAPHHARHLRAQRRVLRRLLPARRRRSAPCCAGTSSAAFAALRRAGRARLTPTVAFRLGEKANDPLRMYLADVFTVTCNLAALPGLSRAMRSSTGRADAGRSAAHWAALSTRRRCCALRARWSERWGHCPLRRGWRRERLRLRGGDRAGGARPASHQEQDLLRLLHRVRR